MKYVVVLLCALAVAGCVGVQAGVCTGSGGVLVGYAPGEESKIGVGLDGDCGEPGVSVSVGLPEWLSKKFFKKTAP